MRKLLIALLISFVLTGCGSTVVTQEEYDKVVAEKESLEKEVESCKLGKSDIYELAKEKLNYKATETKKKMEDDCNGIQKYLEENKNNYQGYEDVKEEIDELYDFHIKNIDWIISEYIKTNEELAMQMGSESDKVDVLLDGILFSESNIELSRISCFTRIRENFPNYDAEYNNNNGIKSAISSD